MIKNYEDFEIIITRQGDNLYYADLGSAPGKRQLIQPVAIELPEDENDWIEVYQGRKSYAELAELGNRLFKAIIRGELAEKWHACMGEIDQRREVGLRLRFSLQANALTQVPLELLCRKTGSVHEFLALDPATPVVRSPRLGASVRKRPVTLPLRMLVVIANPLLEEQTDPLQQQRSLEDALAGWVNSGNLLIDYLGLPGGSQAYFDTLHHALVQTEYPFDIVHFIGHGALPDPDYRESEGVLFLVDPKTGRSKKVRASSLGILADNGVRVVVLQACEGARDGVHSAFQGIAQQLIAKGLPGVVAMQCPVDTDVASWFCRQFYDFWLSESGLPIERAVTEARKSVHEEYGERASAWVAPVLFIREESTEVLRVEAGTHSSTTRLKRGVVFLEQDRIEDAVAELRRAHARIPDQARRFLACALVAQAQMLEDEGNEEGALQKCEQALKVFPEKQTAQSMKVSILLRRGDAAYKRGELDEARVAYEQAEDERKIEEVELRKQEVLRQEREQSRAKSGGAQSTIWSLGHILDEKYEITGVLATTKRCEVYRAEELTSRCTVAVKRLMPTVQKDKDARQRFDREVRILRQMNPDFVLNLLHEDETESGGRYFVTEFADKGSLEDYLRTKPDRKLNPLTAFEIAKAICQGLDWVHGFGIVHRDIKPANIFLFTRPDGSLKVKLADFSIAGAPKRRIDEAITYVGSFMGTWQYAAPEQIARDLNDFRSDLFSWAAVFLEMLTGTSLWDMLVGELQEVDLDVCLQKYLVRLKDEFPERFFVERGVPQEFIPVLQKALRKHPELRYQSVAGVQEQLDSIRYSLSIDIERVLTAGDEHIRKLEWQAAGARFERGLELCGWCSSSPEVIDQLKEKTYRLKAGQLYAQGMLHLSQQQWQGAVEALEALEDLCPVYSGTDVAEKLEEVHREQQRERTYRRILAALEHERWTTVVRLAKRFDASYVGPDGKSIGQILKDALYAQGRALESIDPQRAYYSLHELYGLYNELYKKDSLYEDVAVLCTRIAFHNATRRDVPVGWEQKVEWLEKVIEIDPDHREGRTQKLLDQARHRLARELMDEDRLAAIAQLEQISSSYDRSDEVYQALTNAYYWLLQEGVYARTEQSNCEAEAEARYLLGVKWLSRGDLQSAVEQLGQITPAVALFDGTQVTLGVLFTEMARQACQNGHWNSAKECLDKALTISPNVGWVLRCRLRELQARVWAHTHRLGIFISVVVTVLATLATGVLLWAPWWRQPVPATPTVSQKSAMYCNGDFEDGLSCWQHGGELNQTVECDGDECYAVLGNPDYSCEGGVPVGEAWIKQRIEVPDTISPTLSLEYQVFSYDLDTYDFFQVSIDGHLVFQAGNTEWTKSSCDLKIWDSGWQSIQLDLSPYIGRRVELLLRNANSEHGWYNTWTYVDDVEVR